MREDAGKSRFCKPWKVYENTGGRYEKKNAHIGCPYYNAPRCINLTTRSLMHNASRRGEDMAQMLSLYADQSWTCGASSFVVYACFCIFLLSDRPVRLSDSDDKSMYCTFLWRSSQFWCPCKCLDRIVNEGVCKVGATAPISGNQGYNHNWWKVELTSRLFGIDGMIPGFGLLSSQVGTFPAP